MSDRDLTDHENGAFGEYLIAKAAVQFKIPGNLSDQEAATLGVSTMTVVRPPNQEVTASITHHC